MGFHAFQSHYDWSRLDQYRQSAEQSAGGLIDLSVGSPVDAVPAGIQESLGHAANSAVARGYPRVAGTPALRTAIADWLLKCRGVDVRAVNAGMVPTVGSKEAVSLMASLLHLGDGDVIVQPKVSYPTYEIGSQLAGAAALRVDDVADVESWVHVPSVKAVWVNSPSNPTGRVLTLAQLTGIVSAARSIGAIVLSDECYALLTWPANAVSTAATQTRVPKDSPCALNPVVCSGNAHGVLALYSLSKQSNMAGYRTAFIAGDPDIIAEMTQYRRQIGQIIPGPVQAAMTVALRDTRSVCDQWSRYHERLASLVAALRIYGYDVAMPQGGLYIWAHALTEDCWQDLERLAEIGILAAPGEFYGDTQYVRFSVTASDDAIDAVCQRLIAVAAGR